MTKQEKSEKLSKFLADRVLTQKKIADKLGVSEPCVTPQIKRGVPMLTCLFLLFVHRIFLIVTHSVPPYCLFDNLLYRHPARRHRHREGCQLVE